MNDSKHPATPVVFILRMCVWLWAEEVFLHDFGYKKAKDFIDTQFVRWKVTQPQNTTRVSAIKQHCCLNGGTKGQTQDDN